MAFLQAGDLNRRATTSRRGRAALAWALAGLVGLQAALCGWADWQPSARDPLFGRKLALLRQRLATEPDRPLVLVLGTSRSALGLRFDDAERPTDDDGWDEVGGELDEETDDVADRALVFNFGLMGAGPIHELLCLRRLLGAGIRPAKALIEVHPLLLHEGRGFGELAEIDVSGLDSADLGVIGRYVYEPATLYARWWQARLCPAWSHRMALQMNYASAWLDPGRQHDYGCLERLRPSGWIPHELESVSEELREKLCEVSVRVYEPAFHDFHVTDKPDRALREMIELCREERIEVELFLMPEASRFREGYSSDSRDRIASYLGRLTDQYAVVVHDLSAWCADRNFADSHHLLPDGAADFSRRFAASVLDAKGPALAANDGPANDLSASGAPANGQKTEGVVQASFEDHRGADRHGGESVVRQQ
jgi:hypothetical protein